MYACGVGEAHSMYMTYIGSPALHLRCSCTELPQLGPQLVLSSTRPSGSSLAPMPAPNRSRVGAVQHPLQDFLSTALFFASARNCLIQGQKATSLATGMVRFNSPPLHQRK